MSLGEHASHALGSTPMSTATGSSRAHGTVTDKVVAGVIGQADVRTEPLSWIRAQNMLSETEAAENEGSGSTAPETMAELSPQADARRAGNLIADKAYSA